MGLSVLVIATTTERSAEKSLTWQETEIKSRLCAASSYCLPVDYEDAEHLLRRSPKQVTVEEIKVSGFSELRS